MPTLKGSNRSNGPRYQSPNLGRAFHSDGGKSSLLSAESPKSASYASDYTHLSSPTLTANYDPNSPQARIRNESYYASRLSQCIPSIANSSTRSRASTDTSTRPTSNYSNIRSPTQVVREHDSNNCTSSNDVEDDFEDGVRFVDAYHGPHRILTRENSDLKQELYACYKQATCGPCQIESRPSDANSIDVMKWEKWMSLGRTTPHEAMKRYIKVLDTFVEDWRRHSKKPSKQSTIKSESSWQPMDAWQDIRYFMTKETEKWQEAESRLAAVCHENTIRVNKILNELVEAQTKQFELTRKLEDDAKKQKNQMEVSVMRQEDLSSRISSTKVFAIEARISQVFRALKALCSRNTISCLFLAILLLQIRRIGRKRKFAILYKFVRGILAV
ncbi:unnamed protein product [Albugo candida]|uniref:ACB domain-containing protein n=1 Tax=Albugo candida TaxID=65357 RepID=A0A024FYR5_9STRA|nr:unnamed protein product [Albugo candida]|eukprot:CCI39413.1 unnamed protein product [Albugo candida]